jgi:hypothetical protein
MQTKQTLCLIEVDRPLTEGEHFDRDIIHRFAKKNDMVISFYSRIKNPPPQEDTPSRIEVVLLKDNLLIREKIRVLFLGFGSPEIQKEGYAEFEIRDIEKEAFYEALTIHFSPEIRMFSIEKPRDQYS